jgi:speckle-type POZ protein
VFDVGGFGWQIVFLTRGMFANGEHVAAFLTLVSEDQQEDIRVRASFQLSLVDVTGSTPPHTMVGSNEFDPEEYRSGCSGCLAFKNIKELEAHYLHDDRITIECVITVEGVITADNKDAEKSSADEVPPFDMNFEGTDVIFEVEGEAFPAHKRVLAMHSPVFKAELYGAMREHDMERITIGEVQPVVFETLLHFIYTGRITACHG